MTEEKTYFRGLSTPDHHANSPGYLKSHRALNELIHANRRLLHFVCGLGSTKTPREALPNDDDSTPEPTFSQFLNDLPRALDMVTKEADEVVKILTTMILGEHSA